MAIDRDYAGSEIRGLVASGFHGADEIAEIVLEECLDPDDVTEADSDWVRSEIRSAFLAQQEAEQSWPAVTDWDRLDAAFAALDQTGIIALHNAGMTLSDGISDVTEEYDARGAESSSVVGYCFYHFQDVQRAINERRLMLAFGDIAGDPAKGVEIGQRIAAELQKLGFQTLWNGTIEERIEINGLCWQKRGPASS